MPPLRALPHPSSFLFSTLHAQHRVFAFPHPAHLLFTEPPSPFLPSSLPSFPIRVSPFFIVLSLSFSLVSFLFLLLFSVDRRLAGRGVCNRNLYKENGSSYPTRVRSSHKFFSSRVWEMMEGMGRESKEETLGPAVAYSRRVAMRNGLKLLAAFKNGVHCTGHIAVGLRVLRQSGREIS